jgi:hypothetical protein
MGKIPEAIGALVLTFVAVTMLGAGFFLDEIRVASKMIGAGLDGIRSEGVQQQKIYCNNEGQCGLGK